METLKIAIIAAVIAMSLLFGHCEAAAPERVRVEFLSKRTESSFKPSRLNWPLEYCVVFGDQIWLKRRAHIMSDECIALNLAYDGPEHRVTYIFLYVGEPDQTSFADLAKVIDRLKWIVEKNVTGNREVVIEVLAQDWVRGSTPAADDTDEKRKVWLEFYVKHEKPIIDAIKTANANGTWKKLLDKAAKAFP